MKKFLFLILFFLISGCTSYTANNEEENLYFSIRNVASNKNDTYIDYTFYTIDVYNKHNLKEQATINDIYYGYSGGLIDKKDNLIYQINRTQINPEQYWDHNGDQLYIFDVETGSSTRCTEGMYGNNYIFKNEEKVYLVSTTNDMPGHQLFEYDLLSKELKRIGPGEEYNVRYANYNPITKEIVLSAYKEEEMDLARESDNFENPPNYIFTYKDGKLEYLFKTEKGEVLEIVSNNDYVIYYYKHSILYGNENRTEVLKENYFTYNRTTQETTESLLGNSMNDYYMIYYLSKDSNYVLCEYYVNEDNIGKPRFELVKYDLVNNEKEVILDYYKHGLENYPFVVLMKE